MVEELTERQTEVFEFILECFRSDRRPPTVREIAKHFGFRSPKAVTDHLDALERKGYIERSPGTARNIHLPERFAPPNIPVAGHISAGSPTLAVEDIDEHISLKSLFGPTNKLFGLRVEGDSMEEAGIFDGDYVIVATDREVGDGCVGVALIGDEATVKTIFHEDDQTRLQAESSRYEDILMDRSDPDFAICGPVVGIIRQL